MGLQFHEPSPPPIHQRQLLDAFARQIALALDRQRLDNESEQAKLLAESERLSKTLLNSMFPPGATQKNAGTVQFDNPDRHLAYSRQTTIGYERQLGGNMAVSADYLHMNLRDLYMRKDLNAGLRPSTSRTATIVRPNPNFSAQVLELVNTGWADYDGLQLSLQRRFSRGYSYRISYTLARSFGNVASAGNVETIAYQVLDQLNLEQGEARTGQDRPHIFSMDGSLEVPRTRGLLVSGVMLTTPVVDPSPLKTPVPSPR